MHDELGIRMKNQYESRTKQMLPRRTYTIIRLDGKAFHTYTNKMEKPFDNQITLAMDNTARMLCKDIQGAKFAYTQSDEISILLTDFDDIHTQSWFDGNVQKIVSVSASMAGVYFNKFMGGIKRLAFFDSRVFIIPDSIEVENYFIWRQNDAIRNSISATAQSLYSPKQLHGKNNNKMQEMIFQKGTNWNDSPERDRRGSVTQIYNILKAGEADRTDWQAFPAIDFLKDRKRLVQLIPKMPTNAK